jgi:hypothetical protein
MCLDRMNNLISFFQIFRTYTEVKGLTTQATTSTPPCRQEGCEQPKKDTYNAIKSKATRTQVQRASASSSVRSMLRPDLRTSRSVFSSGKCDTVATNAEWDPSRPC